MFSKEFHKDVLAAILDWGPVGVLKRMSPNYLIHRFRLRRKEKNEDFDGMYGTETSIKVRTRRYEMQKQNLKGAVMYWPSPCEEFSEIMFSLNSYVCAKNYSFIDLGCGKGRTLILALHNGFERVEGVEISKKLCVVARENLDRSVRLIRSRVDFKVVNKNVLEYYPTLKGPYVFYMFNPFDAEILIKVLEKILGIVKEECTHALIAFLDQSNEHERAIERTGMFNILERRELNGATTQNGKYRWVIYQSKAV